MSNRKGVEVLADKICRLPVAKLGDLCSEIVHSPQYGRHVAEAMLAMLETHLESPPRGEAADLFDDDCSRAEARAETART